MCMPVLLIYQNIVIWQIIIFLIFFSGLGIGLVKTVNAENVDWRKFIVKSKNNKYFISHLVYHETKLLPGI